MASLIPGYEYDIFISYRQKDNKGDRWVSEFVDALKDELESTFKEEISVYFDINPHDGLLETHDVDASLKEKLKCLVFIPVLSRTYCDPRSFAWEHEFKVFVDLASRDKFGLKVKPPDGNAVNRVVPVRIHDLDIADIQLCESMIGGELHGIEFIYKEHGVNRPLRSKEDIPGNNLYKTFYRNQINKVANTVNEIIMGMRRDPERSVKKIFEMKEHKEDPHRDVKTAWPGKNKLLIGAGILAIIIIAALFVYPGLTGRNNLKKLISKDGKIPIAVMPFQNMTNDTSLDIWQGGIQSNLITSLSNSEDLKVRQVETITSLLQSKGITDFASLTPPVAGLISKEIEANVLITGSIKQSASTIRVNTQLIDSRTGEAFKSFQVDGTADSFFIVTDSLSRLVQEFIIVSVMSKELKYSDMWLPSSTRSAEAFKNYIYGEKASDKGDWTTAIDMFMKAIKIDSNLYQAYNDISFYYLNSGLYDQAKVWCRKFYSKLDIMDRADKIWAEQYYHSVFFKDDYDPFKYLLQQIEVDDQQPSNHFKLGWYYDERSQYDKAIPEYEKALEIFAKKWKVKPNNVVLYTAPGTAYCKTGHYREAGKIYKKAEKDFPDNPRLIERQAALSLTLGDTVAANKYIKKYFLLHKDDSWSEASIKYELCIIYWEANSLDKAEEYIRQALSLEPENPRWMNMLAWFLIENDRKINEALELVDSALKLSPDIVPYLDTKGWGLYKQGNYKESLEILQKIWDSLPVYNYDLHSHLEAARKAVAGLN
jgi:tetratricopeptide (TPR) repeat protein/TolB-like protein